MVEKLTQLDSSRIIEVDGEHYIAADSRKPLALKKEIALVYFPKISTSKVYHDSPCQGASENGSWKDTTYEPFLSESEAKQKLKEELGKINRVSYDMQSKIVKKAVPLENIKDGKVKVFKYNHICHTIKQGCTQDDYQYDRDKWKYQDIGVKASPQQIKELYQNLVSILKGRREITNSKEVMHSVGTLNDSFIDITYLAHTGHNQPVRLNVDTFSEGHNDISQLIMQNLASLNIDASAFRQYSAGNFISLEKIVLSTDYNYVSDIFNKNEGKFI